MKQMLLACLVMMAIGRPPAVMAQSTFLGESGAQEPLRIPKLDEKFQPPDTIWVVLDDVRPAPCYSGILACYGTIGYRSDGRRHTAYLLEGGPNDPSIAPGAECRLRVYVAALPGIGPEHARPTGYDLIVQSIHCGPDAEPAADTGDTTFEIPTFARTRLLGGVRILSAEPGCACYSAVPGVVTFRNGIARQTIYAQPDAKLPQPGDLCDIRYHIG